MVRDLLVVGVGAVREQQARELEVSRQCRGGVEHGAEIGPRFRLRIAEARARIGAGTVCIAAIARRNPTRICAAPAGRRPPGAPMAQMQRGSRAEMLSMLRNLRAALWCSWPVRMA